MTDTHYVLGAYRYEGYQQATYADLPTQEIDKYGPDGELHTGAIEVHGGDCVEVAKRITEALG